MNNWNIFPSLFGSKNPFGSDIPLNISLTINALSRSDRTETLSAPKLVTQDNKRATVKMQTTYYFPESWDEVEVEVSTSGDNGAVTTIHPAVPEFNEDGTSLGIAFTVLPTIRKNRDIGLDLKVDITSYLGPVVPKLPPNLLKIERTSATVRVVLSVNVSTKIAIP